MSEYKRQLIAIAKQYCKVRGYQFLFVSDDMATFGYDLDGTGKFIHRSFESLLDELKGE